VAFSAVRGVSFDFGDTIVGIDERLLLEKIRREGLDAQLSALGLAIAPARRAYEEAIASRAASHPWKPFMKALLEHAAAEPRGEVDRVVDALWLDQPRLNLWRKLLPGIVELARELRAHRVPIGILTNSEGKAATLVRELGLDDTFEVVIDSGVLGVAKPDPAIFHAFAGALAMPPSEIVHIGDSLRADVHGALAVSMHAIWFAGSRDSAPPGVAVCENADELRNQLVRLRLLPG
jgi:HAD superfamily hydrolase (TIGR01549 family)